MIEIKCQCGDTLIVPKEYVGRTGKCKKCGAVHQIIDQPPPHAADAELLKAFAKPKIIDKGLDALATIGIVIGAIMAVCVVLGIAALECSGESVFGEGRDHASGWLVIVCALLVGIIIMLERIRDAILRK